MYNDKYDESKQFLTTKEDIEKSIKTTIILIIILITC